MILHGYDVPLAPRERRLIDRGGPFELELIDGAPAGYRHAPAGLARLFARARRFPDQPQIWTAGCAVTFGELLSRAQARAGALAGRAEGRRIALLIESPVEWLVSFMAVSLAGGVCVVIPPTFDDQVLAEVLERSAVGLAMVDDAGADRALRVFAGEAWRIDRASEASSSPAAEPTPVEPDDEALVVFTSGTSGAPKGVSLTNRNLMTGVQNMLLAGALAAMRREGAAPPRASGRPATLLLSPLSHISGLSQVLLSYFTSGALVLDQPEAASDLTDLISRSGARALYGASAPLLKAWLTSDFDPTAIRKLEVVHYYGLKCPAQTAAMIAERLPGVRLASGYGMTETVGAITAAEPDEALRGEGSVGRLLPTLSVRIGEDGEISIAGPSVARRYIAPEALNARAFDGAWLQTGDLGRVEADGRLCVHDRSGDFIGTRASALYFSDIEDLIRGQIEVDDVGVCSLGGEAPANAAIVLVGAAGLNDLAAQVGRLLDQAAPGSAAQARVLLGERIPRTLTGKVERRALARYAQTRLAQADALDPR